MGTFNKHYIIPLIRGGKDDGSNVVYWPAKINKAWSIVFNNLTPAEAKYFVSLCSIPHVYLNKLRLNQLRRQAALMELEDKIRDKEYKYSTSEIQKILNDVNQSEDPQIRRETIEFNPHHIKPSSRGKRNDDFENVGFWMIDFHAHFHTIFGNLRIPEIFQCIELMNQSDDGRPFEMSQSTIRFIRKQAISLAEEKRRKKPVMRFHAKPHE